LEYKENGMEHKNHPLVIYEPGDLVPMLKLSLSTVLEMLHRGEIPAVVVRRGSRKTTFRIYADAFEKWLAQNSNQASQ
jgi:excisionase family DNA binding protein